MLFLKGIKRKSGIKGIVISCCFQMRSSFIKPFEVLAPGKTHPYLSSNQVPITVVTFILVVSKRRAAFPKPDDLRTEQLLAPLPTMRLK